MMRKAVDYAGKNRVATTTLYVQSVCVGVVCMWTSNLSNGQRRPNKELLVDNISKHDESHIYASIATATTAESASEASDATTLAPLEAGAAAPEADVPAAPLLPATAAPATGL
jgi:hypothetical protein